MPKGQHLTQHQQGIVRRYYDNADTIALNKLGELVGELYLASDPAKKIKLWKSAELALRKLPIEPARANAVVAAQDVKSLAELVAQCSPGGKRA